MVTTITPNDPCALRPVHDHRVSIMAQSGNSATRTMTVMIAGWHWCA
jgi:hypothetical protein